METLESISRRKTRESNAYWSFRPSSVYCSNVDAYQVPGRDNVTMTRRWYLRHLRYYRNRINFDPPGGLDSTIIIYYFVNSCCSTTSKTTTGNGTKTFSNTNPEYRIVLQWSRETIRPCPQYIDAPSGLRALYTNPPPSFGCVVLVQAPPTGMNKLFGAEILWTESFHGTLKGWRDEGEVLLELAVVVQSLRHFLIKETFHYDVVTLL